MTELMPSPVELVAERIRDGTTPNRRTDPFKLSLILQGGAMRGSISAGAAVAFEALIGDNEPFDRADSTSAGAFCWGTLASRNAVEGASIYYEELSQGFISLRRGLRGGKFADLSLLVNAVAEGPKAFDFDRILHSDTASNIYATSAIDAKKVRFSAGINFLDTPGNEDKESVVITCQDAEDILAGLEASAHLPFYAGNPVYYGGQPYMDGGLSAGRVPIKEAIDEQSTHILVVSTDRVTDPERYKRNIQEKIAVFMIRRKFPELAAKYWSGHDRHIDTLRVLNDAESTGLAFPAIEVIKADPKAIPGSMETEPARLFRAAKAGELAVLKAFSCQGLSVRTESTVRFPRQLSVF